MGALAVGWRAARAAQRQARAERRARTATAAVSILGKLRRPALTLAGLATFDVAAWTVSTTVGLLVTGASLFALELLTND